MCYYLNVQFHGQRVKPVEAAVFRTVCRYFLITSYGRPINLSLHFLDLALRFSRVK